MARKITISKNTHELAVGDVVVVGGAELLLMKCTRYPDHGNGGDVLVFETDCIHLDENAIMPKHWAESEGGYRIQGNCLAMWGVLTFE